MTRVVSYNILVGATRRVNQLTKMIRAAEPDIVGLVEATNPAVVEELAKRLDMQAVMSGRGRHAHDWQVALLSRLPIVYSRTHMISDRKNRPILEVCVEEEDGQQLTVFVAHLSAAFSYGRAGNGVRKREVRQLLRIIAAQEERPHLIMGDFNALAPGDGFKASFLLRYIVELDQLYKKDPGSVEGHPHLNFVVPPVLRVFNPLLRLIPRSRWLCRLFDAAASLYAPRGSIALLQRAGYVDCFRDMNPYEQGFTCPAAAPAGRIDFIFASPEQARQLESCYVATEGEGIRGEEASDHLSVVAEFGEMVGGRREELLKVSSGLMQFN